MIDVGSDFSGVGAFDQALMKAEINYNTVFSCDMDKFARQQYVLNYGSPGSYPFNVYDRHIPNNSLDIYMTSPPCQSFSFAGKRGGETDKRGLLFYNSHEFILENKPRFFIFENVKGLLSDNRGVTFSRWVDLLAGKSLNGLPVLFPNKEAAPYHVYFKVLNSKHYGTPQNRERVFIVGIRDDNDNNFSWPKTCFLQKKVKDILENNVDDKYFLSERMIKGFKKEKSGFKGRFSPLTGEEDTAYCVTTNAGSRVTDNFIKEGYINQDSQASAVFNQEGISNTLCSGSHGYANGYVCIGAIRGRNIDNPKSREVGSPTVQMLEKNNTGLCNTITTVQKDNIVIYKDRIRRLTPRECFRLMSFPDSFKFGVSDTQLYKQAGNSIDVNVLSSILEQIKILLKK